MDRDLRPDAAARALVEIDQRQGQVIGFTVIPWWFWWAVGALMIGLSAAVESRRPLVIGIGIAVFVAGVLATAGRIVVRAVGNAQVRKDLLGLDGVLAILGFVALVVAITLPAAFLIEASGVSYPATLAAAVEALVLVVGGPALMRYLRDVMLANRASGRR